MVKEQGKEAGGPWDCFYARDFYGWEAERVVAVTGGLSIMELITRAKIHLSVIFVDSGPYYAETKKYFQQVADLGLVEMLQLSGEAVETGQQADDEVDAEIEDKDFEDVEEKVEENIYCMSGCCTS